MILYIRVYIIALIYAAYDPWASTSNVWKILPKQTIDSDLIQVSDETASHREICTLGFLMFFERLPFIVLELILAYEGDDLLNNAAIIDLGVNIVSLAMQTFEFLSVYEFPQDLRFMDNYGV